MSDLLRLTGLWKNKDKTGKTYLTGHLNAMTEVVILPNTRKAKENEPDFNMFLKAQDKKVKSEEPETKEDGGL